MARSKDKPEPKAWTASQVVAHNMARAREIRRLTQAEVAERLSRFTGSPWSQASVAQAEGSVAGDRVRQFTANELVALARTFDLPVLYFFLPPEDGRLAFAVPDGYKHEWPWEYLLMLVWGHMDNFPLVADRAAPWGHASTLLVAPDADHLEEPPSPILRYPRRNLLTPEDMLAVAFNGLARRHVRGAKKPGQELTAFIENLRGLADSLEAFNNYKPGTFFTTQEVRAKAKAREEQPKADPGSSPGSD